MPVAVVAATDVGRVRQRNEDHAVVGDVVVTGDRARHADDVEPPVLLAVMDGMGGHPAGDVASRLVAEAVAEADPAELATAEDLVALVRGLDDLLATHMAAHPETETMGTTIVGALVDGPARASAFAAGDSLALWWTGSDEPVGVVFRPDRGSWGGITQVLGGSRIGRADAPELQPHVARVDGPGRLVLSSDGLTDLLGADDVRPALALAEPGACADALVERALEAGGHDNVTVVVVDLEDPAA